MKDNSVTKTEQLLIKNRVDSPLVSVIIPVFNVEKYLEECINSILCQTLTDIEILCINDGSTDSSPDILRKYAEQDRRITVYSQNNRGLSSARNLGMRISSIPTTGLKGMRSGICIAGLRKISWIYCFLTLLPSLTIRHSIPQSKIKKTIIPEIIAIIKYTKELIF